MSGNQITSISQTVTSVTGGVTVMQGHVAPTPAASAGSGANMMSMSIGPSTSMANSNPYSFPISSHANTAGIQPTPGYPANAAQTIIYVSFVLLFMNYSRLNMAILILKFCRLFGLLHK